MNIDQEHEALIQFLYLAPVGLVQMSAAGDVQMMNPVSAQLLMPLSPHADLSNLFTVLEGVAPDLRHLCATFAQPYGKVCDGMHIPLRAGSAGRSLPQVLSLTLLKLDEARLMAVLSDITEQVRRERQLRQNEAWFNAILCGITDYALISLDRHGRVFDWNASISRVTGHAREDVIGQPYSMFYPPDAMTPEHVTDRLAEAEQDGWSLDEGWRLRADGSRFWGSAIIAPLHDRGAMPGSPGAAGGAAEEAAFSLIIRDISDKEGRAEDFRHAAFRDHLTGIANRRAFFDAADRELARRQRLPRPMSLILFDADRFKRLNDQHGHGAGDAVLRNLAIALTAAFRPVDVVARIGGEEFAVLLPSTGLEGARAAAERLRALVEAQTVRVDGVSITYTVSGGVAMLDDGMNSLDMLMKRADQALYAAKARGRNRIEAWTPVDAGARKDMKTL